MGWSIGFDSTWNRDIGYGVFAQCDHPDCTAIINRGLSYVCGNAPYGGDHGCGLYFCEEHREGYPHQLCTRCSKDEEPFDPSPDIEEWTQHKATHPSWEEWRNAQATQPP